ncbi:lipopolysaccharide biosynthesis protein [Methylobacterium nonmethylotrophicum]|uniref:Lipopolysaccharide biosynthesis protein n=1 Tax=Methylobacterium nonmethylotrophicum TaxID=1141884 RepID=A0A4Z0NVX6_9HYPH|nr:lipopolysaccharide biosynthesis protein [Methylobacterium nonmethylotrophicum]TGE00812.1 lipopolysaccharide biosynthesis protein [Methylobacterium nonmethylotrophicum]
MLTLVARLRRSARTQQFASAFVARIASAVLGFVLLLVASRLLTTYEYGVYVFLFSLGSGLGLIAVFGQQNLVLKHYRAQAGTWPLNDALVRYNLGWLAVAIAVMLGVSALVFFAEESLPDPYHRLHLACAFAAVFALSEYLQSYFRVHGRIWLALLPREVVWRGACSVLLWGASILGLLQGATAAMEIVLGLLLLVTLYQIRHLAGHHGWDAWRGGFGHPEKAPGWRGESLLFTANNVMVAVTAYLETVIVGALLGMEQAAFYFVALRYATLVNLPSAAIDTVSMPMIASHFQARDRAGAQRLVGRLSLASFAISSAGAVVMAVGAPYALALFKPDFAAHTGVLMVLSLSSVVTAFFGPGASLLTIGGGERYILLSNAALFSIYAVLLCLVAVPFGILGVAVANVAWTIVINLVLARWVRRNWDVDSRATAFFTRRAWGMAPAGHAAPQAAE